MIERVDDWMKKKKWIIIAAIVLLFLAGILFSNGSNKEEYAIPIDYLPKVDHGTNNLLVEIKGEVIRPGIYVIKQDARMYDLIALAGGFTSKANTNGVNMVAKIGDGMVIYIPTITIDNSGETSNTSTKISINKASVSELMTLPGIGESRAKSIVEYRDANGSFQHIEDIKKVTGISSAIFESIKEYIML